MLIVFAAIILFILSVTIPQTAAYLKERKKEDEITQVGDLTVSVIDSGEVALTQLLTEQSSHRTVKVKNEGSNPLFLRVSLQPILMTKDKQSKAVAIDELIPQIRSEWVDGQDGYYYYLKKLESQKESDIMFTQINKTEEMTEEDTFQLFIKAEAITAYDTVYRDAWWQGVQPAPDEALEKVDLLLHEQREIPVDSLEVTNE